MNREIKFRAWDGEDMIQLQLAGLQYFDFEGGYVLSFAVDGYDGFWAHEQYDGPSEKASKFPIMQFTGLLDKNGKEIYEGDVVRITTANRNIQKKSLVSEIGFLDGAFCALWRKTEEWEGYNVSPSSVTFLNSIERPFIEIIGNIYETPELLK